MMKKSLYLLMIILLLCDCRKEGPIYPLTEDQVTDGGIPGKITGFYLLNEGNMGSNKATLDYFDYETGKYYKNIYAHRNPGIIKELGDVGNDLQIYGDKLYAVINCSNFIEVMDVRTTRHITQISIPNCRCITFKDRHAYVTSYAGPVQIDPNARLGYVAKIDTATLKVVAQCTVGCQPEQMAVVGDKLYVANFGGYRLPHYTHNVSVIDLKDFKVIKTIEVAVNLHGMQVDKNGYIYISSRGDYKNTRSETYIIDSRSDEVIQELPLLPNHNMALHDDLLYVISSDYNSETQKYHASYALWNTDKRKIENRNFISDHTEKEIEVPYGMAVNPENGDFIVTDAKNYITPGQLHYYSADGIRRWTVTTGDIPAHIAFTTRKVKNLSE